MGNGTVALKVRATAVLLAFCAAGPMLVSGCGSPYPVAPARLAESQAVTPDYLIGPGDQLQINVWGQSELSASVPVRPDGRLTMPLIEDIEAAGKTPAMLGRDIEGQLADLIQDPVVTVIVSGFAGTFQQQVRVVGEATTPTAVPYVADMTMLDLMIQVGGLREFAAGNRAVLIRSENGGTSAYTVRLSDLLEDGDISANVPMVPGDVVIVPQSRF